MGVTFTFTGEYEHQLDPKGRLIVPVDWRPGLDEGGFLSPGLNGRKCLFLLPMSHYHEIEQTLLPKDQKEKTFDRARLALSSYFFSGSRVKVDNQGRIFLLPRLRERGALKQDVILRGAGSLVEIWDPEELRLYEEQELNAAELRDKLRQVAGL